MNREDDAMCLKFLKMFAVAGMALGFLACNLGPGSQGDDPGGGRQELSGQSGALTWPGAPPTCYGLRDYFQWLCREGEWTKVKVGERNIWCDGTVFLDGEETDCYTDYATYDCNSGAGCGSLNHVCSPKPTTFCRRPPFGGIQPVLQVLAP